VRIGGADAREQGIVDEAVPDAEVLPRAIARAGALADKNRDVYRALKQGMYGELISRLRSGSVAPLAEAVARSGD